ncbi:hypothetical protein TrVE_jg10474 [Triparma verrucosa]|nr:hypothetical protein TrVE_jg10474 [Triparma verrucosa]
MITSRNFSTPPNPPPDFSDPTYWNSYHLRSPSIDWFSSSSPTLSSSLLTSIASTVISLRPSNPNPNSPPPTFNVLHVGAGTSTLCETLESYLTSSSKPYNLTHVDVTPSSVSVLKSRGINDVRLIDVTSLSDVLSLEREYDVIVDKGLLDCFVHSGDEESLERTLDNFATVLREGGRYVMVTNDDPDGRLSDFMEYGNKKWDLAKFNVKCLVEEGEGDVVVHMIQVRKKAIDPKP